jgi:asparagine synthase (glutamine-hydrolysing)
MSGICGWFNPNHTDDGGNTAITNAMADRLPTTGRVSTKVFPNGALAIRGAHCSFALDEPTGIACAVSGNPEWTDQRVAALATRENQAAAAIQAFLAFGDNIVRHVRGPFSIALIDPRNRKALLCIDRMGIRPLCYAALPSGAVVFATTASSVAAHPSVSSAISNQSLYNYFYFHVIPSPNTIYAQVNKLEPAQRVTINGTTGKRDFYWQPTPSSGPRPSEADVLQSLRENTRAAVERSRPDEHTACFLSGGLDSSTVSGLANEFSQQTMRAYTIGFDQQGFDETEFARTAARHFGLDHVEYYITPTDVAESFELLSTAYDEPFGNSSAIPAYFCARKAASDGYTRLLAGDGGDELFGGNERYAKQKLFDIYYRVPQFARDKLIEPMTDRFRFEKPVVLRKARRYVDQARIPMPDRMQTYNYLEMFSPAKVFDETFIKQLDFSATRQEMRDWYARSSDFEFLDRMLLFDWKLTLADNDIRKVNRMCETAGVNVEYPLLDENLVEYSLQMPTNMKVRRFELRYAFKKAHLNYLPRDIIEKEKHGFGLPFGEWLRTSDEMRSVILPCIERFRDRGILRDEFIDDMLDKHAREHASYFGEMLWLIAVVESWLTANVS